MTTQNPGYTMCPNANYEQMLNAAACQAPQPTYYGWPLVNQAKGEEAEAEAPAMPQIPYAFAQNTACPNAAQADAQQAAPFGQMPQNLYAGAPMINRAEAEKNAPQNLYNGMPVVPTGAPQQPADEQ